jgi:hypothetical protein
VLHVFERTADHLQIIRIRSSDGTEQTIKTTDEHPFFVGRKGWVKAGELEYGDQVREPDGKFALVIGGYYEPHPEGITVYNFEVEHDHNYFVIAENNRGPPVLVHNAGKKYVRWKNGYRTKDGRFASPLGKRRSGVAKERAVERAIAKKKGWTVLGRQAHVRDSLGRRRDYDLLVRDPHGRVIGIEVKSGSARRKASQRAFDEFLNEGNPAVGTGRFALPLSNLEERFVRVSII